MQKKRSYFKPSIQLFELDTQISLVMQSDSEGGPPDPMMAKPTEKQKNPFETNPFGSSTKKK